MSKEADSRVSVFYRKTSKIFYLNWKKLSISHMTLKPFMISSEMIEMSVDHQLTELTLAVHDQVGEILNTIELGEKTDPQKSRALTEKFQNYLYQNEEKAKLPK